MFTSLLNLKHTPPEYVLLQPTDGTDIDMTCLAACVLGRALAMPLADRPDLGASLLLFPLRQPDAALAIGSPSLRARLHG